MADKTQRDNPTHAPAHWLVGLILVVVFIFSLVSLITYDWRDIALLQAPPNHPPANLIGRVGAWTTFCGYSLFGLGLWVLPVWLGVVAFLLIMGRIGELLRRAGWSVLCLFALCSMLQLSGSLFSSALHSLNLGPDAGGAIGCWLMTCLLERWLSPVGGGLLAFAVLIATGIMAVGPAQIAATSRNLAEKWRAWRKARKERAAELALTREEHDRLHDEQETRKAAERGFSGGRTRVRDEAPARRERETRAVEPEAPVAEEDAARRTDEDERRADLRRRAEEARAAAKKAQQQAEADASTAARTGAAESRKAATLTAKTPSTDSAKAEAAVPALGDYRLPSIDLLDPMPTGEAVHGDTAQMGKLLVDTLAQFNLLVEITHIERGPVVTRYELLPAAGIRVERIAQLAHTLQMVLKATSLRIQAPVPGKNVVGIEVPNPVARKVTLREILQGSLWSAQTKSMEIPLALGKDVGGADIVFDLAGAPHLLVAGATGSGKSVCLNAILAGLLFSRRPDELKLLLVDPKRVEFPPYNNLPHLLVPVVIDAKKVAFALRWAIVEMDRRYKLLQAAKVRNIVSFNTRERVQQTELGLEGIPENSGEPLPDKLPYIVIVIDEVADLMITVGQEIEQSITRLAQLSRAVGIHMILATQRPSVNVITGTIKANFPGRLAFQVAQKTDSRTILDQQGAETLIGRGDMLFLNPKNSRLMRAQGALVNDSEIARVVEAVKKQCGPRFDQMLATKLDRVQESSPDEDGASSGDGSGAGGGEGDDGADDALIQQSIQVIRDTRRASTSSLQRRLRIGYTRAARVMDILEERGIVGPPRGADPREILIDLDAEMPNNVNLNETPHAAGNGPDAGRQPEQ